MRISRFEEGRDLQEYTLEQKLPADYQNGSTLKAFTLDLFRWHQVAMSDDLEALEEYARHCWRIGTELRIVDRGLLVRFKLTDYWGGQPVEYITACREYDIAREPSTREERSGKTYTG